LELFILLPSYFNGKQSFGDDFPQGSLKMGA